MATCPLKPCKIGIRPDVAVALYYNAGFQQHLAALAAAREVIGNDPIMAARLAKVAMGTLPLEEGMMMGEAYVAGEMDLARHVRILVDEIKAFSELDNLTVGMVPDGEENSNTKQNNEEG